VITQTAPKSFIAKIRPANRFEWAILALTVFLAIMAVVLVFAGDDLALRLGLVTYVKN
jgi:hypothetical protein